MSAGNAGPGTRAAAIVVAAAGIALAWGASSGTHLFDAGEIVAAGASLGGSHPPGQPLHALIAYAATLVPLGPIPWRIALVSVIFGVLAALSAARIVSDAIARSGERALVALPSAAAIAILLAPAIAPQLGRPEVYTLALFLVLEGARRLIAWAARDPGTSEQSLRVGALCAGLAVAVHPPHALALLAIGAAFTAVARRDLVTRPRAIAWAAIACAVGLLAIAYLPLRGAAGAPMWGEPTTPSGLWAYVSGSAFRRNLGAGDGGAISTLTDVGAFVLVSGGGAVFAIVAALARRGRTDERRRLGLIGLAATAAIVAACLQPFERANPDNVAYAAAATALFVVFGAAGIAVLRAHSAVVVACAVALTASGLAVEPDPRTVAANDLPQLETLAFLAVDAPAPRALAVVRTDFIASAWVQARAVDGARPDVAVLVEGLSTSSWHWRTLADHPLFDGSPLRSGHGDGYAPWVRGAVTRAYGSVEIVAEDDAPLEGRGVVLGPYLALPRATGVERAFAERTIGAPARMIPWTPAGPGGAGHGVVREVEIARGRRFFVRGVTARTIAALRRASAPLPAEASAAADGVAGPPMRRPPGVVRSDAIYATAEDAVRELAVVSFAIGAPQRAVALLEAQAERGDDRALLQLSAIQLEDGMIDRARAAIALYVERHPEPDPQVDALIQRLR